MNIHSRTSSTYNWTNEAQSIVEIPNGEDVDHKVLLREAMVDAIGYGTSRFSGLANKESSAAIRLEKPNGNSSSVKIEAQSKFLLKQKWQGYVIAKNSEIFTARLSVLFGEGSDLDIDLFLDQVSDDDKPLVQPGAIFYLSIGYHIMPSGTRMSSSLLRFQRLPNWSEVEIKDANNFANRWLQLFDDFDEINSTK